TSRCVDRHLSLDVLSAAVVFLSAALSCSSHLPIFFYSYRHPRDLHSFPTRRSSDLRSTTQAMSARSAGVVADSQCAAATSCTQRSEEHTSELQSPDHLVCRLLLEKKKKNIKHKTQQKVNYSTYRVSSSRKHKTY